MVKIVWIKTLRINLPRGHRLYNRLNAQIQDWVPTWVTVVVGTNIDGASIIDKNPNRSFITKLTQQQSRGEGLLLHRVNIDSNLIIKTMQGESTQSEAVLPSMILAPQLSKAQNMTSMATMQELRVSIANKEAWRLGQLSRSNSLNHQIQPWLSLQGSIQTITRLLVNMEAGQLVRINNSIRYHQWAPPQIT